jgi:hypothetical protein
MDWTEQQYRAQLMQLAAQYAANRDYQRTFSVEGYTLVIESVENFRYSFMGTLSVADKRLQVYRVRSQTVKDVYRALLHAIRAFKALNDPLKSETVNRYGGL